MEAFLLFILVIGLLIIAGVVISVRLYSQGALGARRFRRIRRWRSLKHRSSGTVMEETVEEVIGEEEPVEEGV